MSFSKMHCAKNPFKKTFEKHSMYKGKAHVIAQNQAGHDALPEWEHSPMGKKKTCNCWKGHERVPGTKACAKGSCRKIKRKR